MGFPDFNDLFAFTPTQQHELRQFTAYVQGYLSANHHGDGTHSNITADSVALVSVPQQSLQDVASTQALYCSGSTLYWNGNILTTGLSSSVLGSGSAGMLPLWTGTTSLGNSIASDDGVTFTISGTLKVATITTAPATDLTLQPTGDLVFDVGGHDLLPATNYDLNLGALSKKFLAVHAAELWVETLVAQNTSATIGGRVLVAPTNVLSADLAPADTTITVKYNNFANGDRIYLEADSKVEWMAVTSGASGVAGAYTYSVTRNLDGTGANQWYAGDAALNTGTTGKGFIDLYSLSGVLSGAGPTIVGNVRTGTTYSDIAARWAIGNLNGLYGYGADTYGVAMGDATATNITVDATNGFRIRYGTTNKLAADTSGNLSLVGDLSVGTSGVLRSGASAYGTGTGWWLDYNGGTPRFRVGDPAANRLSWDGTNLTLVSATVTLDASGILCVPYLGSAPSTGSTYSFSFANGSGGLGASYDNTGGGQNQVFLTVNATSAGRTSRINLQTSATSVTHAPYLIVESEPATNSANIDMYADTATWQIGTITMVGTTLRVGGGIENGSNYLQYTGAYVYPGSASGLANNQTTYYLASHTTYGLYTNGGLRVDGGLDVGGAISLPWSNAGIEVGSSAASNTPFVDFHSSGNAIDYDVRLGASGGTASTGNGVLTLSGQFVVGAPTGGAKGVGTINATAVYDDNVLLTDWVFDLAYDGATTEAPEGGRLYSLNETQAHTREQRTLPWMPSRRDFEHARSVGAMVTRLWQGQEQQQLYLFELADRIAALEGSRP